MPNKDGPTATKEIRALGYKAAIFGVTGNGLATDIEHFKADGADDVVLKPLHLSDFYDTFKPIYILQNKEFL